MLPELRVLLEHPDFIIIDKPPGVAMHDPEHGIISLCKSQLGVSGLHVVHRLDTPTSGCLILATHSDAAASLCQLFISHSVNKYYLALVDAKPRKKQGTISGDMTNRRSGNHVLLRTNENPAITQFKTYSVEPNVRVALVKPITGKTHQIRVAMKSISAPIIGDQRYGGSQADRLYLHAWHLHFYYRAERIFCTSKPREGELFQGASFNAWLESQTSPSQLNWPEFSQNAYKNKK